MLESIKQTDVMWSDRWKKYKELIGSSDWDSIYLRERGLIPGILELIGDCRDKIVLDAGTGTGWLFGHIHPKEAHACDLVEPVDVAEHVAFRQEDVSCLSYGACQFDLVVASLLLMYCKDLTQILKEFHRVCKKEGELVLSVMHPYFYRTGEVLQDGRFTISEDLSREREFEFHIAGSVGPFIYFYRPLPVYINALIDAGWIICHVDDWFIDIEEYRSLREQGVKSNLERSGKVPLYNFIKAKRT